MLLKGDILYISYYQIVRGGYFEINSQIMLCILASGVAYAKDMLFIILSMKREKQKISLILTKMQ